MQQAKNHFGFTRHPKFNLLCICALSSAMLIGCSSSNDSDSVVDPVASDATAGTSLDSTATAGTATSTAGDGTTDSGSTAMSATDSGTAGAGTATAGTGDAGSTGGDGPIDLNGNYIVNAPLTTEFANVPECGGGLGTLTVTGTTISGLINENLDVTGIINADGTISGGFAFEGGAAFAAYSGMVEGEALTGTWMDIFGCIGTFRAEKSAA